MACAKLLIIAGSDSGGGAGIQADIKAASAMGTFAATAITAITAQNTLGVQAIHPLPLDVIDAQIRSVLDDIQPDAVKLGMLATSEVIETVARALEGFQGAMVLDPVMVAKSGDALLESSAVEALCQQLIPRATLVTPNLPEAAALLGLTTLPDDSQASLAALGCDNWLLKGGHAQGDLCVDRLWTAEQAYRFESARVATRNTHGTGCSYASAIAALLAQGQALPDAVERAHAWLHQAIARADELNVGQGQGPVHHFHAMWT